MTWFHWLLIALYALEAIGYVAGIDLPRKPISKNLAIGTVIVNALLIWGVVHFAR